MSHWYKVTDKQASSWDHKTIALPATPFLLVSPFIEQSFWFSKYIIASSSCGSHQMLTQPVAPSLLLSELFCFLITQFCMKLVEHGAQESRQWGSVLVLSFNKPQKTQNWCTSKLLKPITYWRNARGPLFQPINDRSLINSGLPKPKANVYNWEKVANKPG